MEIERSYENVKFPTKVLQEGRDALLSSLRGTERKLHSTSFRIEVGPDSMRLNTEEEFDREYRDEVKSASARWIYAGGGLQILLLPYATHVSVEHQSRSVIERVLTVFDHAIDENRTTRGQPEVKEPRVQHDFGLDSVLLVDQENLTALVDLLRDDFGEVTIEAHCSDGRDRHFNSRETLFAYENASDRQIVQLSFHSWNDVDNRAYVDLGKQSWTSHKIRVRLSGSEHSVERVTRGIQDRATSMKPWYAPVAERASFGVFPQVAFAIGQGKKRHEDAEGVRKFVMGTLVAGFIVSLAAGIATAFLVALA